MIVTESDRLEKLKQLSPTKYKLLLRTLQKEGTVPSVIPRYGHQDAPPLSFIQQRVWFLDQLTPGNPSYNMPTAVRLTGELNLTAMTKSINKIIERHESLRTKFTIVNGYPIQNIAPQFTLVPTVVDLQQLSDKQKEDEVRHLSAGEAQRSFDLVQGPLLRVTLLQLASREHIALLTIHHIVCDEWSVGVFAHELMTLYEAFITNQPSPLAALEIQYADFAVWQHEQLKNDGLKDQLNYWRHHLSGELPVTELPTDKPRPPVQSFRGAHQAFRVSKQLSDSLGALSRQASASMYMTLLAAFKVLLYRYSGQTDLLVGTSVAGRNRPELEPLIGFFVNTLVLRTNISGEFSFRDLLSHVRQVVLGSFANQDVSFDQLVEEIQPDRDPSRNPLFQVMFTLQNAPIPTLSHTSLTLSPLSGTETGTAKLDLSLDMVETDQGLIGVFEYNTDLFADTTIARMVEHFHTLLTAIVEQPEQPISRLPLLIRAEQEQLLSTWNASKTYYPEDRCIHQIFEMQVELTPDAPAVVSPVTTSALSETTHIKAMKTQVLTYQVLNQRANQLARNLQEIGVGPEVLVALSVDRSPDMVIGVLAILKAGGAYIPLDPTYPEERLVFMLQDAQPSVLITHSQIAKELPTQGMTVVCIDQDWDTIAQFDTSNLITNTTIDNLAYVIYTSGSTGKPKGAMLTHRCLVNGYVAWDKAYPLRNRTASHLQTASLSFDVFTGDIVRALCFGAKMVICPKDWKLHPKTLCHLMYCERIDYGELIPALMRTLVQYLKRTNQMLDFMRLLIVGSDIWYANEYKALFDYCLPGTPIINSYGLTETTVDNTYFQDNNFEKNYSLSASHTVPIGKPFTNNEIYILDSYLQPVPIGVAGEIYISSPELARGFLDRPDLTAERFIVNPFSQVPGTRMYKTGDQAKYLPDGNIVLLGRIDRQVKIRGFRIELGEIEAVLEEHSAVQTAVVLIHGDQPNNQRLVAYVVLDGGDRPTVDQLHHFLKDRLPAHMMPSTCIILETMPLSPNGKVDRKALPKPVSNVSETSVYVPPRNRVEETIVQVWQTLLQLDHISVCDNFFELGGHSLLAAQLVFKLNTIFQAEVSIRDIFDTPDATVADMAQLINRVKQNSTNPHTNAPTAFNLEDEVILDPTIKAADNATLTWEQVAHPTVIFLTGATGFLGAYLLYDLLEQTDAQIYCLVRASNVEDGQNRIKRNLQHYQLWHEHFSKRIVPLIGDLAEPNLGLSSPRFQQLTEIIDGIYHCGAWVNFVYPYHALKAINATSITSILELASQGKLKPVHFVSTLSVFNGVGYRDSKPIKENDPLARTPSPYDGYSQSKWVAEKILKLALLRGIPICVYRPGFIGGDTQAGITNTKDLIWRKIKGSIQLGFAANTNELIGITPVNYVSKGIVHLSKQKSRLGKAFHFVTPEPMGWKAVVRWMRTAGYPVKQVSYNRWRAKLVEAVNHSQDNALAPFMPLFPDLQTTIPFKKQDPNLLSQQRFDAQNTLNGLSNTSIVCPPTDKKLLDTYLAYFIQSNFLDAPPSKVQSQFIHDVKQNVRCVLSTIGQRFRG